MKPSTIAGRSWRRLYSIGVLILLIAGMLLAQSVLAGGGGLNVSRYVIGGGGGHVQNGSFSLDASIGQSVVGKTQAVLIKTYALCSGFWCGLGVYKVYLPLVLRN
jgi:hypothetical protein